MTDKCIVVSLGISDKYAGGTILCKKALFEKGVERLKRNVKKFGYNFIGWSKEWPEDCPTMYTCPYGFKSYCINEAWKQGYRYAVWADSSLIFTKDFLDGCFDFVKKEGYFFVGQKRRKLYCTEYTANKLGFTCNEIANFEHSLVAGFFGLDRDHPKVKIFFKELQELVKDGTTFRGTDKEPFDLLTSYKIHRHDQTVMYLLIKKFKLRIHLLSSGIKIDNNFVKPK